ncbi:MAG: N-acetylmuramoyl-L-alanine amidase-like domain-containing protein [Saprospiraceae bacterium]
MPIISCAQTAESALEAALTFVGVPYVHGTLEQPGPERLVDNRQAMDCWTFVEQSLALALAQSSGRPWTSHLQALRYRDGRIDGYGSRIHYFFEWALQAEAAGIVHDVTRSLGGLPYRKNVSYMSHNAAKYPRLSEPGTMEAVKAAEARIGAHDWFYVPKADIAAMEHLLLPGDIVATTATHAQLDVTHQGFVLFQHNRAYLLHASSRAGKVVVSDKPLAEYVLGNKDQSGIVVLRIN